MKAIVMLLALLATAKLGYQEYLFRTATRDAIVGAYKEHVVQACQKSAKGLSLGLAPQAWANPQAVNLVIGKSAFNVYLWQVDNALWNARYKNPYLVLTVGPSNAAAYCEYDIVNAAASVYRM